MTAVKGHTGHTAQSDSQSNTLIWPGSTVGSRKGTRQTPKSEITSKANVLAADNYAQYATARWFSQFYGDPDPTYKHSDVGDDTSDSPFYDESSGDGRGPEAAGYARPDYDELSRLEAISFAAGEYIPEPGACTVFLFVLIFVRTGILTQHSAARAYRQEAKNLATWR